MDTPSDEDKDIVLQSSDSKNTFCKNECVECLNEYEETTSRANWNKY